MQNESGVLAIVETGLTGEPTAVSLEAVGAAQFLAESMGIGLSLAVPEGHELSVDGARRVRELRGGTDLAAIREEVWCAVEQLRPAAVLLPDSGAGRSAACTVAARLQAELVTNCMFLKVMDGKVQLGRSCLSNRAFAQLEWDRSGPIVVTVAQGAFSAARQTHSVRPEIVRPMGAPRPVPVGVSVVREVAPTPEDMGVNEADVLVAGGAGVGGTDGFALLAELAGRLGGTVAASRVAVDRGWISSERQVGLTGRSVAPQVYFAFGISGAPQHIAGIRSAGKVVAINRDPRAPIFDVADLAIVADLHELLPALLQRLPSQSSNGKEQ